jgi:hypothetical protein
MGGFRRMRSEIAAYQPEKKQYFDDGRGKLFQGSGETYKSTFKDRIASTLRHSYHLNRDRGTGNRPPPTPPGMRVRTRRFGQV